MLFINIMLMSKVMIIELDKCFECGKPKDDMHHVVPKSLGGDKTIPLCSKCHGLIHDRDFVKHRELHRLGIERAKKEGKFKGRVKGTKYSNETILKKYEDAVLLLNDGLSLRKVVAKTNISLGTVQKVRRILNEEAEIKRKNLPLYNKIANFFKNT